MNRGMSLRRGSAFPHDSTRHFPVLFFVPKKQNNNYLPIPSRRGSWRRRRPAWSADEECRYRQTREQEMIDSEICYLRSLLELREIGTPESKVLAISVRIPRLSGARISCHVATDLIARTLSIHRVVRIGCLHIRLLHISVNSILRYNRSRLWIKGLLGIAIWMALKIWIKSRDMKMIKTNSVTGSRRIGREEEEKTNRT